MPGTARVTPRGGWPAVSPSIASTETVTSVSMTRRMIQALVIILTRFMASSHFPERRSGLVLPVAYDPGWQTSAGRVQDIGGLLAVVEADAPDVHVEFRPDLPLRIRAIGMSVAQGLAYERRIDAAFGVRAVAQGALMIGCGRSSALGGRRGVRRDRRAAETRVRIKVLPAARSAYTELPFWNPPIPAGRGTPFACRDTRSPSSSI